MSTAHTLPRILLADDHEIVREGLIAQLNSLGQYHFVHAWSLATLLAAAVTPPGCDLAVVDVWMPGMDGGRGMATLAAAHPGLPLIILSGAAVLPQAGQWLSWPNVRAIVHKSSPVTQLRAAIDGAMGPAIDAATHPAHLALPTGDPLGDADALGQLSPRLTEVARHAALGLSNQQIATALGLSEGSVKQYLKEVFRTVGVANRTQLALLLSRRERSA